MGRSSLINTTRRTFKETVAQRLSKRLLIILALVLGLLASLTIYQAFDASDTAVEGVEPRPYGAIEDLLDPEVFRAAYLEANGGLEGLDALKSIQLNGTIQSGDYSFEFFMLKSRPDKMLLTYNMDGQELSYGVNSEGAWQRVTLPDGSEQVISLEQEQVAQFQKTAQFWGPLVDWSG